MQEQLEETPKKSKSIKPLDFGARPDGGAFNASEIVAIDDSRFLFCDNNVGDAMFELRLDEDGSMACPLIRRRITKIEEGAVDDLEGLTQVETGGRRFLIAAPSFSLKQRKGRHKKRSKRGKECDERSVLLRLSFDTDGPLEAEMICGFREWLVEQAPDLGKYPRYLPDDGGLNIEGLAWSPGQQALLFGARTPVVGGRPIILRMRIKQIDGPWELANFEMLPPAYLEIEPDSAERSSESAMLGEQGIRSMEYDPSRKAMLVVLGNSTSESKAPFELCTWDGNEQGRVQRFEDLRFHKRMKVEGVTHGEIAGRGAIVLVDDAGGYQVLWDDDPRLSRA
jgi:hypothetical protein